jgi:hypothetical protein
MKRYRPWIGVSLVFLTIGLSAQEDQVVRKYAIGFAKQIMYNCHLEENPRQLNVDVKEWEQLSSGGYRINMKITWIENPLFAQMRTVKGCLLVNEIGCNPIIFVESENIPSILWSGCFQKVWSDMPQEDREIVEEMCGHDFSKVYQGECIED